MMKKILKTKNYLLKSNQANEASQASPGFTLIEVIIVVVIAVLVFISMYSFYASTIKFDTESRYEIIASNLAQEGVELCRNGRDKLILEGSSFSDFDSRNDCTIITGISVNDVGSDFSSIFTRVCNVTPGSDTAKVSCTVSWGSFVLENNANRSVTADAILTNWGE